MSVWEYRSLKYWPPVDSNLRWTLTRCQGLDAPYTFPVFFQLRLYLIVRTWNIFKTHQIIFKHFHLIKVNFACTFEKWIETNWNEKYRIFLNQSIEIQLKSMSKRSSSSIITNTKSACKLENEFVMNFRNKLLLKRINSAKSKIDNKPIACVKHSREFKIKMLERELEEKNSIMARKLAEIYGQY